MKFMVTYPVTIMAFQPIACVKVRSLKKEGNMK